MKRKNLRNLVLGLLLLVVIIGGFFVLRADQDRFIICVENASSTQSHDVSNAVLAKSVEKQIATIDSETDLVSVEVREGCPFTPYLSNPNAFHPIYGHRDQRGPSPVEPPIIKQRREEYFGIFIVDPEIVAKHFHDVPSRWSPEEMMCAGTDQHDCWEVTSGHYFTTKEVQDDSWETMLYPVFIKYFRL
jgi:hypothetical protein